MLYMTSAYDFVLALAVYLHVRGQDSVRQIWDGHDKCLLSTMEARMLPCAADLTTYHNTASLQCECSRDLPNIDSAILHQLRGSTEGKTRKKGLCVIHKARARSQFHVTPGSVWKPLT